jgi:hypothetical protein
MPRYFFHIRDGWDRVPDEEGMEFLTLNLAEVEGHASAHDLAASALSEGRSIAAGAIEITDEDGCVLSRIKVEALYCVA